MIINIITPLTRPENIIAMAKSIVPAVKSGIEIKWHIVVDPVVNEMDKYILMDSPFKTYFYLGGNEAIAGHAHRNIVLDRIPEQNEWVMSLDDDNIIHPALFEWLNAWELHDCEADGIIWDQIYRSGYPRLNAHVNDVKVHNVDTAQYMLKRGLIGDTRFQEDKYEADGLFIQEIYERHRDSFIIVNQPLCYYNYLRS